MIVGQVPMRVELSLGCILPFHWLYYERLFVGSQEKLRLNMFNGADVAHDPTKINRVIEQAKSPRLYPRRRRALSGCAGRVVGAVWIGFIRDSMISNKLFRNMWYNVNHLIWYIFINKVIILWNKILQLELAFWFYWQFLAIYERDHIEKIWQFCRMMVCHTVASLWTEKVFLGLYAASQVSGLWHDCRASCQHSPDIKRFSPWKICGSLGMCECGTIACKTS